MTALPGFTANHAADGHVMPVHEHERQRMLEHCLRSARHDLLTGQLPYEATITATGDCFVLVLVSKETRQIIEVRDLRPVSAHFPLAEKGGA